MSFTPPIKLIQYLIEHSTDLDIILNSPAFDGINMELIGDVLSAASNFSKNKWAPLNWAGDQNPAKLIDGQVISTPGFKEAYKDFVDAEWLSIATPSEVGGMGLPQVVKVGTDEMFYAANMALGLCPMLTSSAAKAILAHADGSIRNKYLPKMVCGEWTGAMCLTEPQAGSDLGPVRTKALDNGDGTYSITGQKIYITWGDHDVADNIIHLVLARLPNAPMGSKGISLFLCPKFMVNDNGELGTRNSFSAIGLEHKLGIHGSPTCVMEFSSATGWLIGKANQGLSCMFTMMNEARLFVGVQGVAIGERAYQAALQYSNDRVQGRTITEVESINGHPDVRRSLIDMKVKLLGARAICLAAAAAGDIASHSSDENIRKEAHIREALLTPVAKAYGSDIGVEVSSLGVQVHGGMGFVEETGAAQHYRDSRIAPIYEGTNGIQAIDLVGRKLRRDGGSGMNALIVDLKKIYNLAIQSSFDLTECSASLMEGIQTLELATEIMLQADEIDALSAATPYLNIVANVISGAFIMKAVVNGAIAGDDNTENMIPLCTYHLKSIMPLAKSSIEFLKSPNKLVFDFPREQLADL
jgi:alkylation response protein AidB-like acyl-CoA dehydrogenase